MASSSRMRVIVRTYTKSLEATLRVPDKILITITANGRPLEGVPVRLSFVMARKNHHGFIFGPSNSSGLIQVNGDEIRREARKEMEIFLMDYADIDSYWTGVLRATPLNRESVRRALTAYRQFRHCEFPRGYEQMLLDADVILAKVSTATLVATVRCEPDNTFTVEAVPAQAQ
jgi:hypothetical protein